MATAGLALERVFGGASKASPGHVYRTRPGLPYFEIPTLIKLTTFLFTRTKQSSKQRRNSGEPFAPILELLGSVCIKPVILGSLLREFLKPFQALCTRAGQRGEAFLQDARHQLAEAEFGFVGDSTRGAILRFGFIDRAEGAEELQALTGRSFADFQTLNDRRETEGLIRRVEQPVDLADRLWDPKQLHDLRKKSHALAFKSDGNRC